MDLGIGRQVGARLRREQGARQGLRDGARRARASTSSSPRAAPTRSRRRQRELRALGSGVEVRAVAGDITTEAGRAAALAACPQVDILVNNAGGPPPGDFRDWDREAWIKAIDANMLTPIELMKATVDKMAERGFGRVVNITSGSVKAPIDVLGLSNGARSGLTGFVAGLARTDAGRARRDDQRPAARLRSTPTGVAHDGRRHREARRRQTPSRSSTRRKRGIPARRFGTPTSSAPSAPSCAACTPATSPARTC